ncbi:MAG: SGNH/GDSL hydrolase family protein [Pseudomonadota bacterium]
MTKRLLSLTAAKLGAAILAASQIITPSYADPFVSPDVLVLGDSQISFGSGPVFVEFFSDLEARCSPKPRQKKLLEKLGERKTGVIGVRSTSLHTWTARSGAAKGAICDVDKKWKVNAGTYGVVNTTGNEFKQMGQGANYQFCTANQSPFEAMLREDYYAPKLLIMSFLGNASKRWAENPDLALKDVQRTIDHLPADLPCIFMTTAPAYTKKVANQRMKAQENIKAAFAQTGDRCVFVEGITPETTEINQTTKAFFRLNASGGVKDPYHPNQRGARHHFEQRGQALCEAIFAALK